MPEQEPTTTSETEPADPPRIYAASLTDYNHGVLHGVWLDAAVDPEQLLSGVDAMLSQSPTAAATGYPAEEWAIHDDTGFGAWAPDEYESPETVTAVARGILQHGLAFAAWVAQLGEDNPNVEQFEDAYLGEWSSVESYAADLVDDFGWQQQIDQLGEWAQQYVTIDIDAFAHDLELGGDIIAVPNSTGGVWLFTPQ